MPLRKILIYIVWAGLLAAFACVLLYTYIVAVTASSIADSIDDLPHTEAALVLGASVSSKGALSPVLKDRADEAIALYKAGKVSKMLVTGDNATLSHNEVDPVGKYMVAEGIPKEDIFLDHAGFDTYSSMYRARDVFAVTSITIVSQPFHLPRAVFIAHSLGLTAYGAGASSQSGSLYIYNYLREIPATVKAAFDITFLRIPKYLGEQYPITGAGDATWGGAEFASTTEQVATTTPAVQQ